MGEGKCDPSRTTARRANPGELKSMPPGGGVGAAHRPTKFDGVSFTHSLPPTLRERWLVYGSWVLWPSVWTHGPSVKPTRTSRPPSNPHAPLLAGQPAKRPSRAVTTLCSISRRESMRLAPVCAGQLYRPSRRSLEPLADPLRTQYVRPGGQVRCSCALAAASCRRGAAAGAVAHARTLVRACTAVGIFR